MERGYNHYIKRLRKLWGRFWYFFWEEDTFLSWAVNIVVAFILIKWVIYPGLGLILMTSHPIVAVVSPSMEHQGADLNAWWEQNNGFYAEYGISLDDFEGFSYKNGFNEGDIMVLKGVNGVNIGDVIVFWGGKKEPIIHRVIKKWDIDGEVHFQTKGDKNARSLQIYKDATGAYVSKDSPGAMKYIDETDIIKDDVVGKAVLRIPYLGYIKIWFVKILQFFHIIRPEGVV